MVMNHRRRNGEQIQNPLVRPVLPLLNHVDINDFDERVHQIYQRLGLERQYPPIAPANPPPQLTIEQTGWCFEMDDRIRQIN